jgi:siroheme synthase
VHDVLVARELVDEAPDDALVFSRAGRSQEEIDALLVSLARRGLETVRLKGGDPFVFGRGAEEAFALARAGIAFEVVPGVSAVASVPAAFDIPVTHRGVASQVTLISAHSASDDDLDYEQLARTPGTLVFFMGLRHVEAIAAGLVGHGLAATTPAAVISRGTRPVQKLAAGMLGDIAALTRGLESPALVVVGDVVAVGSALRRDRFAGRLVDQPRMTEAAHRGDDRQERSALVGQLVLDARR